MAAEIARGEPRSAQTLSSDGRPRIAVLILEDLLSMRTLLKATNAQAIGLGNPRRDAAFLTNLLISFPLLNVTTVGTGLTPLTPVALVAVVPIPPLLPISHLGLPPTPVEDTMEDMAAITRENSARAPLVSALKVWLHALSTP